MRSPFGRRLDRNSKIWNVTVSLIRRPIAISNTVSEGAIMTVTPSIDYTCPDCGAQTTYELVPMEASEPRPSGESREIPSLDFSCARCGASHTYTLSPAGTSA